MLVQPLTFKLDNELLVILKCIKTKQSVKMNLFMIYFKKMSIILTRTSNLTGLCSDMQKITATRHWLLKYFQIAKGKRWNTVEFVETISLNSMNDHFLLDDCGNTSIDVSERSKST